MKNDEVLFRNNAFTYKACLTATEHARHPLLWLVCYRVGAQAATLPFCCNEGLADGLFFIVTNSSL